LRHSIAHVSKQKRTVLLAHVTSGERWP
jgi:hypothetical protein